nr:MAG TPA: hypothetical protein [Caudoviricetes sp.]
MPHELPTCSQALHTFLCGYPYHRKFAANKSTTHDCIQKYT